MRIEILDASAVSFEGEGAWGVGSSSGENTKSVFGGPGLQPGRTLARKSLACQAAHCPSSPGGAPVSSPTEIRPEAQCDSSVVSQDP